MIMADILKLGWRANQIHQALEALADRTHIPYRRISPPSNPFAHVDMNEDHLSRWMETLGEGMGLEIQRVSTTYRQTPHLLRHAGPALFGFAVDGVLYFFAMLACNGRRVKVIGPDGGVHLMPQTDFINAFLFKLEEPLSGEIEDVLNLAGLTGAARERTRKQLLNGRLQDSHINFCWMLSAPVKTNLWQQMRQNRMLGKCGWFLTAYAANYLVFVLSWWLIGGAVLGGVLSGDVVFAWMLLLLTQIPLTAMASWFQGAFNLDAAGILRQRLMAGALRISPDETRHLGVGGLVGRILESEALESLVLSGGFLALLSLIDMVAGVWILSQGAAPGVHLTLVMGWVVVLVISSRRLWRRQADWTQSRLDLTHHLIENMIGHRTRLAQADPNHLHRGEDEQIDKWTTHSRALDASRIFLAQIGPRGWLVLGILGLAPAVAAGTTGVAVAVSLGGILVIGRALASLTSGLDNLAMAEVAWRQVRPIYRAAQGETDPPASDHLRLEAPAASRSLFELKGVRYAYPGRPTPVLTECSLSINAGDRLLLTGPSGGGKSTLAAILAGTRSPDGGVLLSRGLDRGTLGGRAWRDRVSGAPQFQENHIFTHSLAFNLLMGRGVARSEADEALATTICEELGLGPLLEKMPGGLSQMVGDTGWRLSHGEMSRVFIARALIKGADLLILDESFAALDPETLERVLTCIEQRAKALLVIAHP